MVISLENGLAVDHVEKRGWPRNSPATEVNVISFGWRAIPRNCKSAGLKGPPRRREPRSPPRASGRAAFTWRPCSTDIAERAGEEATAKTLRADRIRRTLGRRADSLGETLASAKNFSTAVSESSPRLAGREVLLQQARRGGITQAPLRKNSVSNSVRLIRIRREEPKIPARRHVADKSPQSGAQGPALPEPAARSGKLRHSAMALPAGPVPADAGDGRSHATRATGARRRSGTIRVTARAREVPSGNARRLGRASAHRRRNVPRRR